MCAFPCILQLAVRSERLGLEQLAMANVGVGGAGKARKVFLPQRVEKLLERLLERLLDKKQGGE